MADSDYDHPADHLHLRQPEARGVSATFSEHLAQRVHELERDLANARREVRRLRESRELWKLRYQWAALAARRVNAAEKSRRYRERQAA